jgi:putative DNA primase/helicase
VGEGSNGKSTIVDFVKAAFGGYYAPTSVQYFTSKRNNSSSATPELENKRGKRVVVCSEADAGDKYSTAKLKELPDELEVRGLYKDPVKLTPQVTLLTCSNLGARFTTHGDGTTRRFLGQYFPTRFVQSGEPVGDFQRKANPFLREKLPDPPVRGAFVSVVLWVCGTFLKKGQDLNPPASARKYTSEVCAQNNTVETWLKENFEITGDELHKVKKGELLKVYNRETKDTVDSLLFSKKVRGTTGTANNARHFLGLKATNDEVSGPTFAD